MARLQSMQNNFALFVFAVSVGAIAAAIIVPILIVGIVAIIGGWFIHKRK